MRADRPASGVRERVRWAHLARLREVRDPIDREFASRLDVADLARGANTSSRHLSREFHLAYGEPAYRYLLTRRIERARMLLRRGDLSVTAVQESAERPYGVRDPAGNLVRQRADPALVVLVGPR